MTTTCLFTITGFFVVRSGNRNNDLRHACYDSALACINSPSIPAHIFIYTPPNAAFLQDNTIVWILGKIYYPPPGDCQPAVIEAIESGALPGDPSSPTYVNGMPNFRQPAVTIAGIVSSGPQPVEAGAVEFLLTTQEYVYAGTKVSTVMYALRTARLVLSDHLSFSFLPYPAAGWTRRPRGGATLPSPRSTATWGL